MRIPYVDEDSFLREMFSNKLREEFKGVIDTASTGKEAIKLLKSEKPYDIFVSEFEMSKGSGLDVLRFKTKNSIKGKFIFFTCSKGLGYGGKESVIVEKLNFSLLRNKIKELAIL